MTTCSDAVEELAHACPAEIRQMKDLHLNGRQQMPPARKKQWNQVQKTLTLLAPGLNLTSFLDDCTRVIQTRAHPRAPHARAHAYAHTVLRMRARSCRAKTEAHGTVFCVLYRTPRGNEVIISCSGYSRSERAHDVPGADAVWNKPFPDWRDGIMQRQLVELLADRRLAMDRAYGPNRHTGSGTDRHTGSSWEDHPSRGGRA